MKIFSVKPDLLLITDPPSQYRLDEIAEELIPRLSFGVPLPPGVVIAAPDGRWLILDGNNRACLACSLKRQLPVLRISSRVHADSILQMEAEGLIPSFPHREFLAGRQSVSDLAHQAWIAFEGTGRRTVIQMVKSLSAN
ncbi:MAG: hypothetical protein AB7O66_01900 [Limisphaerales bacterium]